MDEKYFEDEVFGKDFKRGDFPIICVFDNCTFKDCIISDSVFSNCRFSECVFEGCNLSMINFDKCVLNDIKFNHCKLLGAKFDKCDKFAFSVSFEDCNLSNSTFYAREMKKTLFKNCNLKEVDFGSTNLDHSTFHNCDLEDAFFDQTILTQVDFITSYNYSFNPNTNKIRGAKFSVDGLPGLLDQYGIQVKF